MCLWRMCLYEVNIVEFYVLIISKTKEKVGSTAAHTVY